MRFHPNSGSARVLREFNPCHDAKSGQFAAKGAGGCDPGQMTDPGRQRAVYGQQYAGGDVLDRLAFDLARTEVKTVLNYIGYDDRDISREKLKAKVAEDIASLFSDEEAALANEFYNRHSTRVNAFLDEIGQNKNTEEQYRSEYEQYEEEQVDAQRQAADEEAYERWTEARDDYRENIRGALDTFKETVAARVGPYGDLSTHPELPMTMAGAERQGVSALVFLQNHFPDHFDPDTGFEEGFEEILANPDHPLVQAAFADLGGRRIVFDEAEEGLDAGSTYFESEDFWDRAGQKFIRDSGLNAGDYFDADYSDIDSFGEWLENAYGITEESLSSGTKLSRPEGVVGYLVNKWSDTSGDADPMAIAMQIAIGQEFDLGATYSGQFVKRSLDADLSIRPGETNAITKAEQIFRQDGQFLRRFARRMYENTQRELDNAGLDWLTVYRGFSTADTPELKTVNLSRGEVVDILLQPASSFSADRDTAMNFAGYSHGISDTHNVIMAIRIPRAQVLGTPRTGYGAWNEHEVVVLGGRYPAVLMNRRDAADINQSAFDATQRYLRRRNPPQVVIGRGDRA